EIEKRRFRIAKMLIKRAASGKNEPADPFVRQRSKCLEELALRLRLCIQGQQFVHFVQKKNQLAGRLLTLQPYQQLSNRQGVDSVERFAEQSQKQILVRKFFFAIDVVRAIPGIIVQEAVEPLQNRTLPDAATSHERVVRFDQTPRHGLDLPFAAEEHLVGNRSADNIWREIGQLDSLLENDLDQTMRTVMDDEAGERLPVQHHKVIAENRVGQKTPDVLHLVSGLLTGRYDDEQGEELRGLGDL